MTTIRRVAVVGGGTMGNGIAHVFAQNGRDVTLIDVDDARVSAALQTIRSNLDRQVKKGTLSAADADATMTRIRTSTERSAVAGSELIVEAVPEKPDLKIEVLRDLDRAAPNAILATNTSSISISALAGKTSKPERVIGMHFMNPVPVMKLVEVIRGIQTSDETTRAVTSLAEELGKTPVVVRDSPGFIANRVLMPLINEAIYCVMEGVAEPEAIDNVMKLGMNHPIGPLALADLIGLDTCLAIMEVLMRDMGDSKYRPCPLLRNYVAAGWLGRKSGRGFFNYT
jgi:3-hydroxybutyryl-CoA dehydrogenase